MLLILPGVTYQFVRERFRGLAPGHKELGERILRALTAGIVLDTLYVLVGGGWLVKLIYHRQRGWLAGAAANPRPAALFAFLLLVAVPAVAAWVVSLLGKQGKGATYEATPAAWDAAFSSRPHCFVRARLKSGQWVGGWYGEESHASGYPQPADLYLQTTWALSKTGWFKEPLEQSGGIYIRMEEVECLDFIQVPTS